MGLTVVTLLVVGVQIVAIRWGLKPLRTMAEEVRDLEEGRREALSGAYPGELQAWPTTSAASSPTNNAAGPATAMPSMTSRTASRRPWRCCATGWGRAKGHALPYSEARPGSGAAHPSPDRETRGAQAHAEDPALMAEQLDRMEQAVYRQLSRATVTGPLLVARWVDLGRVLRRLGRALETANRGRGVSLDLDLVSDLRVRGDERDFMDLFGNIMENAFKYTHGRVRVTASADPRPTVRVEDDGPGIDPDVRGQVIDRGIRADRAQPGQGIGLAVVAELTALYNGSLEIGSSPLGGASVEVTL